MHIPYWVIRSILISATLAAAVAFAALAMQLLVWRTVPAATYVSLTFAVAPRYAMRNSACVFTTVFVIAYILSALRHLRP